LINISTYLNLPNLQALLGIDHQVRFHNWQPVAIDAILLRPPPRQHPGVLPQDTARGEEGANEEAQTHVHALHQTHRSLEAFVSDGKKRRKIRKNPG
jgi:hypothetical protein